MIPIHKCRYCLVTFDEEAKTLLHADGPEEPGTVVQNVPYGKRSTCRRDCLRPRLHLLGVRADPEHWLAVADCLVFPSHFDAFGSAVLEGLACGLPAVVSRRAGAAELVVEGKTGALLDGPGDPAAWARALRPFLEAGREGEARRAARAEALHHDWARHTARMLEIYQELQAGVAPSGAG